VVDFPRSKAAPAGHAREGVLAPSVEASKQVSRADDSTPCWNGTSSTCTSTDPTVTLNFHSDGDTTGCTFTLQVSWGDGASSTDMIDGGPDGAVVATEEHLYDAPGSYEISWTSDLAVGSCASSSGDWGQFILAGPSTPCPIECLQAANAVAGMDTTDGTPDTATNLTVEYKDYIPSGGYAAAAFSDKAGNIIIANEGGHLGLATDPGHVPYENWSLINERLLLKGKWFPALNDAVQFAQRVKASVAAGIKIYVTGFDLGGVEAQAQAQALQTAVAGGATFGAPGLPTFLDYSGRRGRCPLRSGGAGFLSEGQRP
jgi:hypothetical protein